MTLSPHAGMAPCAAHRLAASALAAACALLAGCGTLQIDVDVYKGPLVNNESVQRDQLVAMAASAKTQLYAARNQLLDRLLPTWDERMAHDQDNTQGNTQVTARNKGKKRVTVLKEEDFAELLGAAGATPEQLALLRNAKQTNDLLCFFERRSDGTARCGFDDGRPKDGIDQLAQAWAEARAKAALDTSAAQVDAKKTKDADEAFAKLDHAVVDLAARMQFMANSLWLTTDAPEQKTYKALLESIANNLIVHADDLRRQADHRQARQMTAEGVERAARRAFPEDASQVIQSLVAEVRQKKEALSTAEGAAGSANQKLPQATEAEQAASAERTAAQKRVNDAAGQLRQATALSVTLAAAARPPEFLPDRETKLQWESDQRLLEKALLGAAGKVNAETLRLEAARWLLEEMQRQPSGTAMDGDPRKSRLEHAQAFANSGFAEASTEPAVDRKAALARLRQTLARAIENLKVQHSQAQASEQQAKSKLEVRQAELARLRADAAASAKSNGSPLPLERYDPVIQAIQTAGPATLKAMVDAQASSERGVVLTFLRTELNKQAAAQDGKDAVKLLDTLPAGNTMTLDAGPTRDALEVQDRVIAQLRFRHLEALRTQGPGDAATARIEAALAAARKQREDLLYVRPTQSYLRSVYAATYTQTTPTLDWRNLLWDRLVTLAKFGADKNSEARIRAELDKAHWQNINTVRVSAAGSSNFVVAKDDVGNWYVKAMGSDPSAMVRAAKNLALYNLGGRFNTNLLRIDELREDIKAENDGSRRNELRDELGTLEGRGSGPAVAARRETLAIFQAHYQELSAKHLKDLSGRLAAGDMLREVGDRWAKILDGSEDANALDQAVAAEPVQAAWKQAQAAAANVTADRAPGDAILASLKSVQAARRALKEAVRQAAWSRAPATAVDAAATEVRSLDDQLSALERSLAADPPKDATALADAIERRQGLNGKLVAARAVLADKRKLLDLARARLQQCVDAVDTVMKPALADEIGRRLRVVEETETAVKVIGRSSE